MADNQIQTMNQGAVAKAQRPVDLLKSMLNEESVKEQFTNALGKHRDVFIASVIDLYTSDKKLQQCKPADIIKQALAAASMQLPINRALGFAYIVPFNNTVKSVDKDGRDVWTKVMTPTFVPGYKGYIQLAMRTGQYKFLNADFVYEGELGKNNRLTGEFSLDGERKSDKIVGYFCYMELLNGFKKSLYMTVEQMADYAKTYSPSLGKGTSVEDLIKLANEPKKSKTVGWLGNFNDMGLKTVIRRLLSHYGYLSVEMQGAIVNDMAVNEQRDELIEENANTIDLDPGQVEFEEMGSGENQAQRDETAAEEDPGY